MSTKKYMTKHIGEKFTSNEGYTLEITDGANKTGYCEVLIDNNFKAIRRYTDIKNGKIKNPYHRSVYNIGYMGAGEFKASFKGKATKSYKVWMAMMYRIYSKKHLKRRPTYKNVAVAEKWHNFQNFAKWFEENYVEGWHLDKDLLSGEQKMYSPETCVFIPQELNSFLANNHVNNTSGETGVCYDKSKKQWLAQISSKRFLGRFATKQEAANCYKREREILAEKWKCQMKGVLPPKAIENIK